MKGEIFYNSTIEICPLRFLMNESIRLMEISTRTSVANLLIEIYEIISQKIYIKYGLSKKNESKNGVETDRKRTQRFRK